MKSMGFKDRGTFSTIQGAMPYDEDDENNQDFKIKILGKRDRFGIGYQPTDEELQF